MRVSPLTLCVCVHVELVGYLFSCPVTSNAMVVPRLFCFLCNAGPFLLWQGHQPGRHQHAAHVRTHGGVSGGCIFVILDIHIHITCSLLAEGEASTHLCDPSPSKQPSTSLISSSQFISSLCTQAYYKGFFVRGTGRWPAVEAWFAALESRETYLGTHSDYYQHSHDLPPQMGSE